FWFGEDQARYVVTVAAGGAGNVLGRAPPGGGPAGAGGPPPRGGLEPRGGGPPSCGKTAGRLPGAGPALYARWGGGAAGCGGRGFCGEPALSSPETLWEREPWRWMRARSSA